MGLPLNAAPLSLLLERGAGRSLGLFFFEKKKKKLGVTTLIKVKTLILNPRCAKLDFYY